MPAASASSKPGPDVPETDVLDTPAAGLAALQGGVLRVVGYVVGTVVNVAATAVLFRHLHVTDTGRYSLAIYLVAIVSGLADLGLTAVGVRELSVRRGDERASIVRNLLGLRVVLSALGVGMITLFAFVAGYGGAVTLGVALAGVGLMFQSTQSTLAMSLITDLRLAWVAGLELMRSVLGALLIVALVLAGAHLVAFLAVSIPVGIVVLAVNAWVVRGRIPLLPAFHASEWWALMRNILPYSAAVAASTLYVYVAVVLVSLLANSHQLGYFTVSTRVTQALIVVPVLAVGAAFPIFSRAARDDRVRLAYALGRVFEVSLLLGVLVALCLSIGSSVAIQVVGGSEFGPSAPLLAIQGVGLGASFVGAVWASGLLGLGRYREIMMISLFSLFAGGALIAVLVLADAARGAAIATAAGEVVLALLNGAILVRIDRTLMPPLRIIPAVTIAAGLAVATTLLDLSAVVSVVVASVTYLAVVVMLGAIPKELRDLVPGRRRVHT
jgi:O-antigen/teichoic acid export membrane protein